jgi:hypothetical protein
VKCSIETAHGLTVIDAASCDCPDDVARNDAVNPPVPGVGEPSSDSNTSGALDVGVVHVVPTQPESRRTTVSPTDTTTVRLESCRVNTKVRGPMVVGGVGVEVSVVVGGTVTAVVGVGGVHPVVGVEVGTEGPPPVL